MSDIIPQKRCYACERYLPLTSFSNNRSRPDGKTPECRTCKSSKRKKWQKRDNRNYTTKAMRIVGLSRDDYVRTHEEQQGKCAICGNAETGKNQWGVKKLAVDHDHATGQFRGLLCHSCNVKLGVLEDKTFVQSALDYIQRTKSTKPSPQDDGDNTPPNDAA